MSEFAKRAINPPSLFNSAPSGFSQGIRTGQTIYCSGQVSRAEGLEAQTREAFTNVRTLLAYAGATMGDIVKMTIYSTDDRCWQKTAEIRNEFVKPPFPAATMVVVKGLARPEYLVEVDVTAIIGAGQ
jgi:2-iminobutanoate/2-iminopropanoate deaminase